VGDLNTHAMVGEKVMALLKDKGPKDDNDRPRENYIFFELGNFFTDLSQLRDPFAWIGAKIKVWQTARKEHWTFTLDSIVDLDGYLEEMMGQAGVHGELPTFLREFARLIGCEKFVKKVDPPIPVKEFDRIFEQIEHEKQYKGYTQYWPHEHLDFPPWPYGNVVGYRSQSKVDRHQCDSESEGESPQSGDQGKAKSVKRKVLDCLDLQIEFCAELLTTVEFEWRNLTEQADTPANREKRNAILALYGHVSHVIEDFFFHSNFIDKAWSRMQKPLPGNDNTPHWQRVFLRRLRSPKGTDNTNAQLSTKNSDFNDLVYTGCFGGDDVFFTLKDALKTFQTKHDIRNEPWFAAMPSEGQKVLLPFFDDTERKKMNEKDSNGQYKHPAEREKWFKAIRDFVNNSDSYIAAGQVAAKMKGKEFLHEYSVKALKKMCEIDKKMYDKYSGSAGVPDDYCGCFAFMMELISQADEAEDKSNKRAAELDQIAVAVEVSDMSGSGGGSSPYYMNQAIVPSHNGAARETIGTHSLINKDNARKQPLFEQSLNVAVHVACYIAEVMCRQIDRQDVPTARFNRDAKSKSPNGAVNTVSMPKYVNWLDLLRHFLCHPDECEHKWHVEAMWNKTPPQYHVVKYAEWDMTSDRMKLVRRDHLKELYKNIATNAEADWQKVKTT